MVKAFVFDLYGVLALNGWQDFKTRHFEGRWDEWEPIRRLGQQLDAGEATEEEFVEAIMKATGETASTVRYQFTHTRLNESLLAFIRSKLHGNYKVGLLSNASRDVLPAIFSPEDRQLFDAVVMSASVGRTKPDPIMFEFISKELGLPTNQIVFIDDQKRHLGPAAAAGMTPIHFISTEQTIKELERLGR